MLAKSRVVRRIIMKTEESEDLLNQLNKKSGHPRLGTRRNLENHIKKCKTLIRKC